VAEVVRAVETGKDVVEEVGKGRGVVGVEGVVGREEEGVVGGLRGVKKVDDVGVVVDEGGEVGGVRTGFEDLVNGFVGVVVVIVAGVLVIAVVVMVVIMVLMVALMMLVVSIMVIVVVVVGIEDGQFLPLLSGGYGTHKSIPVKQSIPRVR